MLLLMSFFQWWYGDGLKERIKFASVRLDSMIDFFSFGLLVKTLFSPFRQISAGTVEGSLEAKMRAFADRLFSRMVGAVVRLLIMTVGAIVLVITVLYALLSVVIWLLLPAFPAIGFVLMIIGWVW